MKSAIAINNTGVELLKRGQYESAQECFRDAIALVANVFPDDPHNASKKHLYLADIGKKMTEANQRLAQASQSPARAHTNVRLDLLLDDEGSIMSSANSFWRCPSADHVFVVRLEHADEEAFEDPQIVTCIFLSNYAACYTVIGRSNSDLRCQSVAVQLLRLAYSGMARLLERSHNNRSTKIVENTCVILQNLIGCLLELRMDHEVDMFSVPLGDMLLYIHSSHTFLNGCRISIAGAA